MVARLPLLAATLAVLSLPHLLLVASQSAPPAPRPPVEIPFSRLKADAVVAVAFERGAIATDDAIWIPQRTARALLAIDAKTNTPRAPIALPGAPCAALAHGFGSLWVPLCDEQTPGIARVDPESGKVTATVPLTVATTGASMAVAVGSLWAITDARGIVSRIDPDTNKAVAEVYVNATPTAIAAAGDTVWVTSETGDQLTRIDAHTNLIVETIKVGPRPTHVAIAEDAVWTLNRGDGSVTRVSTKSNKVEKTIAIGEWAKDADLAAGEGAVWLSAAGAPIVRIDPRSNRAVQRFTGDEGGAIAVGHGSVWIRIGAQATWRLDPKLIAGMR